MQQPTRFYTDSSVPSLESGLESLRWSESPRTPKNYEEGLSTWPHPLPSIIPVVVDKIVVAKKEPSIPEFVPKGINSRARRRGRGRKFERERTARHRGRILERARSMSPLRQQARSFVPSPSGTPSSSVNSERGSGSSFGMKLEVPGDRCRGLSIDSVFSPNSPEFVPRARSHSPRPVCMPPSPALEPLCLAEAAFPAAAAAAPVAPAAAAAHEGEGGEGVEIGAPDREVNPLELDFGAMNGTYACGRMKGVIDGFTMNMTAPNGKAFVYHLCVGKVGGEAKIEARIGGKHGTASYCVDSVLIESGRVQPTKLFWTDLRLHKRRQPYVWQAVAPVEAEPEGEEGEDAVEEDVHVGLWVPELHAAKRPEPHMGLWVPEIHHAGPIQNGEGEADHEIEQVGYEGEGSPVQVSPRESIDLGREGSMAPGFIA